MTNIIKDSDIAIIGMACRFPHANNIESFWNNLCEEKDSITFFSNNNTIENDTELEKIKAAAILDNIDCFDADFFGYSEHEAEITDPQHRLALECAWEALEDGGYNSFEYNGLIGVFAGCGFNTYLVNNILSQTKLIQTKNIFGSMINLKMMIGNDKDYLPTRISYKLNLRGPSVNIQTACSTSLVTVHYACQSILNGECDMALACASNIIIPQKEGYLFQEGMVFSPDGKTRTFDANAQGTVFGSGVGVVLLKSLSNAIADQDAIYAVIKATAINNDGAQKVGFTSPSVIGQANVIAEAIAIAEVSSESITYIEAHGTGTPLGDPIEIRALEQAFNTSLKSYCAIGSVKTNIGHLGCASGMAGLIKTVLALQHKKIPASLYYESPNPHINFSNSPFYVNTKLKEWGEEKSPLRAGVSAFGIGGTNAHIILEEAPLTTSEISEINLDEAYIFTLSAKNHQSLINLAKIYRNKINDFADKELSNICFTTNVGREHFDFRAAFVVSSCKSLYKEINNFININLSTEKQIKPRKRKTAFLFAGMNIDNIKILRQFYYKYINFQKIVNDCCIAFKKMTNIDLLNIILTNDFHDKEFNDIKFIYPIFYIMYVALAELLKYFGITYDFAIGEDVGIYAAGYNAGILSLEEGLRFATQAGNPSKIFIKNIDYKNLSSNTNSSKASTKYISSFTGLPLDQAIELQNWLNADFTKNSLENAINYLINLGINEFIEVGSKLSKLNEQCISSAITTIFSSKSGNKINSTELLYCLCELYCKNHSINWLRVNETVKKKKVHLPTYPFQLQRYWVGESEK